MNLREATTFKIVWIFKNSNNKSALYSHILTLQISK